MNTWLNLEEKTVVVTGGASGIGRAVAQEFLNLGANVAVCDMNPDEPEFENSEDHFLYVITNVTSRESVSTMISKVTERFGTIDVLVNNAGINIPRLLIDAKQPNGEYELDDAVFDAVLNVNLRGVFLCAQEAGRIMVRKGSGVIINMSSECSLEGSEGQSIYAATKNAVNSFTRSWAKELGKQGIRVVGVAPGILEATGLRTEKYEEALAYTRGLTVDAIHASYSNVSSIPLGRPGRLAEVADLVCYLASERASYIHGVTYNVAGGKTRG